MVTIAACDRSTSTSERLADAGKRWASLPDSCLDSPVTHYEEVQTDAFSDGEFFKLTVDTVCGDEWRMLLSRRRDLDCSEDMPGLVEANFYDCLDDLVPGGSHTRIAFRDPAHAEFLWVNVR